MTVVTAGLGIGVVPPANADCGSWNLMNRVFVPDTDSAVKTLRRTVLSRRVPYEDLNALASGEGLKGG
jgi:hypothetical protein